MYRTSGFPFDPEQNWHHFAFEADAGRIEDLRAGASEALRARDKRPLRRYYDAHVEEFKHRAARMTAPFRMPEFLVNEAGTMVVRIVECDPPFSETSIAERLHLFSRNAPPRSRLAAIDSAATSRHRSPSASCTRPRQAGSIAR